MSQTVLKLPHHLLRTYGLRHVLASVGREFRAFVLSPAERRFADELLRTKPNLWVYRCHQRRFCGDFFIVDMSSSDPALRPSFAVELKRSAPLKSGVAGTQLSRWRAPYGELVRRGVLAGKIDPELLYGSGRAVLERLSTLKRAQNR